MHVHSFLITLLFGDMTLNDRVYVSGKVWV